MAQEPKASESVVELARWVNDNYVSMMEALEKMAERNEATAIEMSTWPTVAKTLTHSARNWRAIASDLREKWLALPDEILA